MPGACDSWREGGGGEGREEPWHLHHSPTSRLGDHCERVSGWAGKSQGKRRQSKTVSSGHDRTDGCTHELNNGRSPTQVSLVE